ncbi:hypothetical protein CFP65_1464 [Kitasatospora sp. MMS16-BH015]|uniref:DUF6158 family protein n=1 Tax=Kitasatospora sp. MMS16-BH015 TaxID=2018025 RepID=UPI000CA1B481|nr:DUF6158 family protein [Kitasatospora sp. MMS16-BH015]AUG76361.1 hypothetical protein CFP65_1464 [Kitasatospora sp. MMS16-BH015]
MSQPTTVDRSAGIPPDALHNDVLLRELAQLHRTRHETFLYGSEEALRRHTLRTGQLEAEFVRRFPYRQVAATRTRSGARAREAATQIASHP